MEHVLNGMSAMRRYVSVFSTNWLTQPKPHAGKKRNSVTMSPPWMSCRITGAASTSRARAECADPLVDQIVELHLRTTAGARERCGERDTEVGGGVEVDEAFCDGVALHAQVGRHDRLDARAGGEAGDHADLI